MRNLGLALLGSAALASSTAASAAIQFVGDTQGCITLAGGAACTVANTNTVAGVTFNTGHFNQLTSNLGYVGIGGNSNSFGFISRDNSSNNYVGDTFTLLVNFTVTTGVSGGGMFQALLSGDVSGTAGAGNGVHFHFNPSSQIFHSSVGDFKLTVDDLTVGGNTSNTRITGFIQAAALPEPATWAMMLVGFAGMGMAMRRRRSPARLNRRPKQLWGGSIHSEPPFFF